MASNCAAPEEPNYAVIMTPDFAKQMTAVKEHLTKTTEMGILKVFIDYKVFDLIPDDGDIAISKLAEKVGAQQRLLERFSNFLVATRVLSSPTPGRIAHTIVSRGYKSNEGPAMTIVHIFNFLLTSVTYWPDYFEKNGLQEPQKADVNPIGLAMGYPHCGLYDVLETNPKKAELFNAAMNRIAFLVSLKDIYDFDWVKPFISKSPAERPLVVDVGGGKGQGLKAILAASPFISPSRCVLVDRPDVIEENKRDIDRELLSVQLVEGNMFEEQPVKGALIYHISRVLNDWPDDDCIKVLKHMRAACAPDSRILIVEQLLLPHPAPLNLAHDIFLMNWGGKRRNGSMFQELAAQAGLSLKNVHTGKDSECGVIELVPVLSPIL